MICFHKGTGPIAAAIRWQTRGKYAHASWLCGDGTVFESHAKCGVAHVANPWVNNDGPVDVFALRCATGGQVVHVQSFLQRRVGSGYDWLGVVRFLSHVNRDNMERWFCSELVAEACEMAERPLLKTDGFRISPASLSWSTELVPVRMGADMAWWNETFNKGGGNKE
ncbi:MAG: hypothetical protein ACOYM3_04595 [Terrimicrobiaceae bacterium]